MLSGRGPKICPGAPIGFLARSQNDHGACAKCHIFAGSYKTFYKALYRREAHDLTDGHQCGSIEFTIVHEVLHTTWTGSKAQYDMLPQIHVAHPKPNRTDTNLWAIMTGSVGSSRKGVLCRIASISRPSAVCGRLRVGCFVAFPSPCALLPLKGKAAPPAFSFLVAKRVVRGFVLGEPTSVFPIGGPPRTAGEECGRL